MKKSLRLFNHSKMSLFRNVLLTAQALLKKVFSGVGISFKGSGFYKNDHGANSKNKASVSTSKDSDNKSSESSKEKSTSDKQSGGSVKKETKAPGNAGSAKTDN